MRHRPPTHMYSGVLTALPIAMGYIPAAFAYGVLAEQAGLSGLATALMSLIVFAGASQYVAVALIGAGQPALTIVLTTFIVNIRHLLMSAALAPYLAHWSPLRRIGMALQMTDETFALHSTEFPAQRPQPAHVFGINGTAHAAWVGGSILGFVASGMLPDLRVLGFDFALPAMFIALLVTQIRGEFFLLSAGYAGLIAVGFSLYGSTTLAVVAATLVGATSGLVNELFQGLASPPPPAKPRQAAGLPQREANSKSLRSEIEPPPLGSKDRCG